MVCAAVHVQREEIPELPLWYRVLNEQVHVVQVEEVPELPLYLYIYLSIYQGDCVEAVHRRLGHPALPPRGYIHHGNTIKV